MYPEAQFSFPQVSLISARVHQGSLQRALDNVILNVM